MGTVRKLRPLCRVASVGVGVFHEGEFLFRARVGDRDIEAHISADDHSLYALCSTSKTSVSAALGILVDEGKLQWADPVGKHLPEFKPRGDARVGTVLAFIDSLRHSRALANPVVSIFGPDGKVIVPREDFINVVNNTPTEINGVPLYETFQYSNVAYGLLTLVIGRLSGLFFAQFVQEKILDPLEMRDTALFASRVDGDANLPCP